MKKRICIFIGTLILISCNRQPTTNDLILMQTGSVRFVVTQPAEINDVTSLVYAMVRDGFTPIGDTIAVAPGMQSTQVTIGFVPAGLWWLTVDAMNSSGNILYTGALYIEIKAGTTTVVNLALDPSSSVILNIRWGNNAGKAAEFDGVSGYINVASPSTMESITTSMTMEAWVNPNNENYYHTVMDMNNAHYFLQIVDKRPGILFRNLDMDYSGAENYHDRILIYDTIPINKWSHLACTLGNERIMLYINGEKVHECTATGSVDVANGDFRIGMRAHPIYQEFFSGLMDEIRVWNIARTRADIQATMYSELQGNESGLIGYWNFNTICNGDSVPDLSGHQNTGIVFGEVTFVDSYAF